MDELERVFEKYPTLTSDGLAVSAPNRPHLSWHARAPLGREAEFEAELLKGRQELRDRRAAIEVIAAWLKGCPKLRGQNRKRSSYGLKHLCERYMLAPAYSTYVSEGEFIAAAVLAGFTTYLVGRTSTICTFNMPERWLKEQASRERSGNFIELNEYAAGRAAQPVLSTPKAAERVPIFFHNPRL